MHSKQSEVFVKQSSKRAGHLALGLTVALTAVAAAFVGGCNKSDKSGESAAAAQCPTCVTADEKGFHPSSVTLAKGAAGEKQTLTFTRTSDETCATAVAFPELGITKDLPLKQPVAIELPVEEARTLTFQCGMGMYKSSVVVR
jgi:plastocyanin domain-containing protein